TFFLFIQIEKLITDLTKDQNVAADAASSFEAHPADTTKEHLEILHKIGFNRISIGVQEFSDLILKTINRKQTTEQVVTLVNNARAVGYDSINFDLLYGLPHQTLSDIDTMMDYVDELRPERIAFYGYAHVPWIKPSQRAYGVMDLPKGMDRWNLFEQGKKRLLEMGYQQIGIDHFALPTDELLIADNKGELHRNFMGYTAKPTELLIGLGASSISDSWSTYVQNEKHIEDYKAKVHSGQLPIIKGHNLTEEDKVHRQHILNIMCNYGTSWADMDLRTDALFEGLVRLQELEVEGFVEIDLAKKELRVLEAGRPFIRNIALLLDARYWARKGVKERQFSRAL
ncbi:MAG: radical SAM protein, partial [Saprospiraceae bacterium]